MNISLLSPIKSLNISLFIVFISWFGIVSYELHSMNEMRHIVHADFKLSVIHGLLLRLEEDMTMSLRLAVLKKEKKWGDRYQTNQSILENIMKTYPSQSFHKSSSIMIDDAWKDQASQLFSLQNRSFDALKEGDLNKARAIIFGEHYSAQRKKYSDSMNRYEELLQFETDQHLNNKIQNIYYIFTGAIFLLICLMTAWIFTNKNIRRLKRIADSEAKLEELLYYDQVNKMHQQPVFINHIPSDILKLQKNRDHFLNQLNQSLEMRHFVLYYQPIVHLDHHQVTEAEVLLRWQHPIHGLLSPTVFLPLCENTEFMVALGKWVFSSVCEQIQKWHALGHTQISVAVNLAARQLNDAHLVSFITHTIETYHIPPSSIKLEITESAIMENTNANVALLQLLKNKGFRLSLDDFGTGYSSLSYLKQFPVDTIKIDKSFVSDMATNITSIAIIESIINLAKNLNLTVIAEGVETETQLLSLKKLKCDKVQGYFYSKPLPAEQFTQFFMDEKKLQSIFAKYMQ